MEKSALLQKVLALKQNGYTNKQIISGLSDEGLSMNEIQEAMVRAELKQIIEEQNKSAQQPLPPPFESTQSLPPLQTPTQVFKKVQQSSSSAFVPPTQESESPILENTSNNVVIPPNTNLPPTFINSEAKIEDIQDSSNANVSQEIANNVAKAKEEIIAEIKSELERIVEIIVAEKLKQYEIFADEVRGSQKEISAKIKAIEETTKHLSSAIERNDIELTEQTKTLNEHIQKLTAELVAMSDIVEKILPVFVDNVKKLTVITDKISSSKDVYINKGKKVEEKE